MFAVVVLALVGVAVAAENETVAQIQAALPASAYVYNPIASNKLVVRVLFTDITASLHELLMAGNTYLVSCIIPLSCTGDYSFGLGIYAVRSNHIACSKMQWIELSVIGDQRQ